MEGDQLHMPSDFLQDLDLWLQDGSVPSPARQQRNPSIQLPNAGPPGFHGGVLASTAPPAKPGPDSFVDALLEDAQALLDTTTPLPVKSRSLPTPPQPQKSPTSRDITKKPTDKPKKGRPPASTQGPQKKKAKTNKSTSQRQKEELAYLKSKADQLGTELETLRQKQRDELEKQQQNQEQEQNKIFAADNAEDMTIALVTRSLDTAFAPPMQPEISLWERIAKRQREEKAKSEVENAKLREMVQSQMRLVKSFERLLRKRRIWDQLQVKNGSQEVARQNEDEILEEMLREMDAQYPHVDTLFKEHGLSDSDPNVDIGDDATMKYSPTDGMYLEFKEKKYMPFDYKMVDEVVWRSFGEGKLKLEDAQVVILKSTDELVFSKLQLPLPRKGPASNEVQEPENMEMVTAMKRFYEEDRVVYVWRGNMSVLRPNGTSNSPELLIQKGYSTVAKATLPDGSPGCVVKSYTSSIPTLSSDPPKDSSEEAQAQHREVGILTETILTAYKQSRQSITQTLENLLLDEMMAKSAATTPTAAAADIGTT